MAATAEGVAAVSAALRAVAAAPGDGTAAAGDGAVGLGAAAIRAFARGAPSGQLGAVAGELGAAIGAVMRRPAAPTDDVLADLLQAGTHVCVSADRAAIATMLRALTAAGAVVTEAFCDRARRPLTILLARALRRCPAVAPTVVDGLLRPAVDALLPSGGAVRATLAMTVDLTRGLVLSLELLHATTGNGAAAHGAFSRLLQSVAGVLLPGAPGRPPVAAPASMVVNAASPQDAALRALGRLRAANEKGWSNAVMALPPGCREAVAAHSDKIKAAAAAGGTLTAAVASRAAASSLCRRGVGGGGASGSSRSGGGGYARGTPPSSPVPSLAASRRAPIPASPVIPSAATTPDAGVPSAPSERAGGRCAAAPAAPTEVPPAASAASSSSSLPPPPTPHISSVDEEPTLPCAVQAAAAAALATAGASVAVAGVSSASDGAAAAAATGTSASALAALPICNAAAPSSGATTGEAHSARSEAHSAPDPPREERTGAGSVHATPSLFSPPPGRRACAVRVFPLGGDDHPRVLHGELQAAGEPPRRRPSTVVAPSLSRTQPLGLPAPLLRSGSLRACTPPPRRRPSVGSTSTGRLSIYSLQSAVRPPTASSPHGGGDDSPMGGASGHELTSSSVSIRSSGNSGSVSIRSSGDSGGDSARVVTRGDTDDGPRVVSAHDSAAVPPQPWPVGLELATSPHPATSLPSGLCDHRFDPGGPFSAPSLAPLAVPGPGRSPGGCDSALLGGGAPLPSPDAPLLDDALMSTTSTGGGPRRILFSMRAGGGRRRSSSYSALARDRAPSWSSSSSVTRAATPSTTSAWCDEGPDELHGGGGGGGFSARGRFSSIGASDDGSAILTPGAVAAAVPLVADSTFQSFNDVGTTPVSAAPLEPPLSAVAPAMRRLRARSRSVTVRACSLPLLDGGLTRPGGGLLSPCCSTPGFAGDALLLPLTQSSTSSGYDDLGVDDGGTSGCRGEQQQRAGGAARGTRVCSLPSPFAAPSLGDVQPVYLASSELSPLPQAATAAPAAVATVLAGLQADGTEWEAQFGALLLLRRLAVHHPDALLSPPAAAASLLISANGVLRALTSTAALPAAATQRARGRSAGSLTVAMTPVLSPNGRPPAPPLPDCLGGGGGGGGSTAVALTSLLPLLLACGDSLRSSVSRHALMALADVWGAEPLAGVLDGGGVCEVEHTLALLLRRACDTSAFLSDAASAALRVVVTHAGESRLLAALLAACAHRNTAVRCAAAPWLDRAVAHAVAKRSGSSGCVVSGARGAPPQQQQQQQPTLPPLPPLLGRDLPARLLQAACAQLTEGSPAARHAGHRLVHRLAAAGWADGRALGRLPDRDSLRLREALGRAPPTDAGAHAAGGLAA